WSVGRKPGVFCHKFEAHTRRRSGSRQIIFRAPRIFTCAGVDAPPPIIQYTGVLELLAFSKSAWWGDLPHNLGPKGPFQRQGKDKTTHVQRVKEQMRRRLSSAWVS